MKIRVEWRKDLPAIEVPDEVYLRFDRAESEFKAAKDALDEAIEQALKSIDT